MIKNRGIFGSTNERVKIFVSVRIKNKIFIMMRSNREFLIIGFRRNSVLNHFMSTSMDINDLLVIMLRKHSD